MSGRLRTAADGQHHGLPTPATRAARRGTLLRYASDGLVLYDRAGEAVEVGPSYLHVLGYGPAQRCRMRTAEMVHPDDLERWRQAWSSVLAAQPDAKTTVVVRARHARGEWCSTEVTMVNALDDPVADGVVATIRDVSGRDGDDFEHPGRRGALEELADRRVLTARLVDALARRPRYGQVVAAVVKLDQLHLVARACGHGPAEDLLVAAARRLRASLRDCDTLGLIDHDRLVVICETHGEKRAVTALAKRVAVAFSKPFGVEDDQVVLTASIGVAVAAGPEANADTLLDDADLAMAGASVAGGNRWSLFTPAERAGVLRQVTLPGELRRALRERRFVVHYQPVVDLATGQVAGAEALVRWAQLDGTLAGPDSFIAAAETSGVIVELGAWVLHEACRVAAAWPSGPCGPLYAAVNLSARQLEDPKLPAVVKKALAEAGLDPARLTLEVTESMLVADPETAIERLHVLREIGVRVAMDDFGTGYSSLAYLKRLPVDVLKIDRCFITGLGGDPAGTAIVAAVVGLAKALGLDVIGEGVETETEAGELARLGCPHAQGYLYGRPGPADQLGTLLAATGQAT